MSRIRERGWRESLPSPTRADDAVQGHWLLARLGKRVLRPGGVELSRILLDRAELANADVLEVAPGLGRTASEIVARHPAVKTDIRQSLARVINVNARPLTIAEWTQLLADHGLVLDHVATAPMALLEPRRLIADEGLRGALRFAKNMLLHRDARRRVIHMRRTFRRYREQLTAAAIVAHKPGNMAD